MTSLNSVKGTSEYLFLTAYETNYLLFNGYGQAVNTTLQMSNIWLICCKAVLVLYLLTSHEVSFGLH